ncbi:chorismate-binding protein [Ramlibacter rhizophilus]|uniref:Chorismate-utilising enzyme C-terminal domain-containing protein n=1 Tax=Ramlibacter rhizophilus TaxID=1781167 RepID=A0A4Z0BG83_9BURK|nr:chorismate-binding protein [Ramlibacter rhizophilus]TFY97399.1 hypothetical protein EZ242_17900 [Ramlibacter rhizophilus]
MLRLQIERHAATPEQAQAALASLDEGEGAYFGVEAGIAGLHPLQATLLTAPALRLRLWGDGVEAEALSNFGRALLAHEALASWRREAGRRPGGNPLDQARRLLACFAPSPDVLLLGALPFEAHRLQSARASVCDPQRPLGVLYFPGRLLRRDAEGTWTGVDLRLPQADLPDLPHTATGHPPEPRGRDTVVPHDDLPPGDYARMVERALATLRTRPLVSLTLSQSYRRRVEGSCVGAFARLRAANPAPASFFLNDGSGMRLFGASPDLQLVVRDGAVQALPVCGTVARRPGAQGEAESLRELFNEEVDAAALAVCSDALRNDLAPWCLPGSLRLLDRRRPLSLATVVHAVDRLGGTLRPGADAWDLIAATAAPVMLTGTPRQEALRAIGELEPSPRGWYGGMVVQVASDGDALVGTILRAACVRQGVAEVRAGGDLLADSSPAREEAESRLKTRSLWRAFGLEAGASTAAAPWRPYSPLPAYVQLVAPQDPFQAALCDCLAGLGVTVSDQAQDVAVLAGEAAQAPAAGGWVAIGDAACRRLAAEGQAVQAVEAEYGRALRCETTSQAPLGAGLGFSAGRYARLALQEPSLVEGWQVWATDSRGHPVALVRGREACLLFRPDSLLGDDVALAVFAAALAQVARP